jgi:hypothetical protein
VWAFELQANPLVWAFELQAHPLVQAFELQANPLVWTFECLGHSVIFQYGRYKEPTSCVYPLKAYCVYKCVGFNCGTHLIIADFEFISKS